jgi:hypothetical protein
VTAPPAVRPAFPPSLGAGVKAAAVSWALVLSLGWILSQVLDRVAHSAVIAFACAATVPVVALTSRRADGTSAVRPASWALLAWVPYVFGGAAFQLSQPLVNASFRCGNGVMGLFALGIASVPVVFATLVVSGVVVDRFRFERATRLSAYVTVALSLVVLAASLRRSHEPEPEDYVASLPTVAVLTSDSDRFDGPGFSVAHEDRSGALAAGCELFTSGSQREDRDRHDGVGQTFEKELGPTCAGVRVLRDPRHDVWIVQTSATPPLTEFPVETQGGRAEVLDLDVSDVASSLRPPTAWKASLAVGFSFALAVLGSALRTRRRAAEWRAARPGVHGGGGWVTFEDGTPPVHFARALTLPMGPVLVLESSRTLAHYREHGRPDEGARLTAGSVEQLRSAADARATDLHAYATLVALLTLAPMLAAYLHGLLG